MVSYPPIARAASLRRRRSSRLSGRTTLRILKRRRGRSDRLRAAHRRPLRCAQRRAPFPNMRPAKVGSRATRTSRIGLLCRRLPPRLIRTAPQSLKNLLMSFSYNGTMQHFLGAPSLGTLVLLAGALLLAFSFETINGFHDTANAVATVIYTNTLKPWIAVVWSGIWNFTGVLLSSGAVAFTIVALLPVELVIHVGTGAGFAMVFALLFAALIWNFATWYVGIPASSSHTLIGSIVGVGLMNAVISGRPFGDGVNWGKVHDTFAALLISPIIGFVAAGLLLLIMKFLIRNPKLYESPEGDTPPVWWIRILLVLTCTGVSYAHGSNDGQKGMGLIM